MRSITTGVSGVVLQAVGAGLAFGLQLMLARVLGATEYGSYSYYFTIATMVAIWSRIGSDLMVMKIGGENAAKNRVLLHVIVQHGRRTAIAGSFLGGIALVGITLVNGMTWTSPWIVLLAALLVLPLAQNGVLQAALLVLDRPVVALLPEMLLRPIVAMLLIGVALTTVPEWVVHASTAMAIALIAACASTATLSALTNRLLPPSRGSTVEKGRHLVWAKIGWSLMLVNATYLLFFHADTLVLGFLLGPEMIGGYQVAKQISQLGLFAMVAIQFVFSPRMAGLVAAREWARLRVLYKVTILIGGGFSASVLIIFSLLGDSAIGYFGTGFGQAKVIALVMLASQVVISLFGPIGTLASMGGHARVVWSTYLTGGLLLLGLGPQVVEKWGLLGAAFAYAIAATSCVLVIGARIMRHIPLCGSFPRGSVAVATEVHLGPPK